MLRSLPILILLVSGSCGNNSGQDFAVHSGSYEYIFHGAHDLFLVIREDSCYFFPVIEGCDYHALSISQQHHAQYFVQWVIERNDSLVQPSDLNQVREIFKDVLADFRCADSHVYYVDLSRLPAAIQHYLEQQSSNYHFLGYPFWNPFSFFFHLGYHLLPIGK